MHIRALLDSCFQTPLRQLHLLLKKINNDELLLLAVGQQNDREGDKDCLKVYAEGKLNRLEKEQERQ